MIKICTMNVRSKVNNMSGHLLIVRIDKEEELYNTLSSKDSEEAHNFLNALCFHLGGRSACVLTGDEDYLYVMQSDKTMEKEFFQEVGAQVIPGIPEDAWEPIDLDALTEEDLTEEDEPFYYRVKKISDLYMFKDLQGKLYEDMNGYILETNMMLDEFLDRTEPGDIPGKLIVSDVSKVCV